MEIIALQEYTDKYVSLYQGEIRNIQDNLANKLIEQGIVAEHDQTSSSNGNNNESSNNYFVTYGMLNTEGGNTAFSAADHTPAQIQDAIQNGAFPILKITMNQAISQTATLFYFYLLIQYKTSSEIVFGTTISQYNIIANYQTNQWSVYDSANSNL